MELIARCSVNQNSDIFGCCQDDQVVSTCGVAPTFAQPVHDGDAEQADAHESQVEDRMRQLRLALLRFVPARFGVGWGHMA